jgi:hypothetical protein
VKSNKTLKKQLDNLIPKLHQIENHALSKVDAHTKELYMSLLAAIALEDRKLAQSEERFLQTLCSSIKEVDLESIKRRIDKIEDNLEESLKAIEDNNLGVWLFIDSLILCRLDSMVTEKESELLGSLADSMSLSRKEVGLCLKLATIILSQDEALLYELIPEVPEGFPFFALHEAYNNPWFEAKLSFSEDLAEGRELKGKYFIHQPVRISGERELNNLELVFAEGTSITIEKEAKLKITGSKLTQTRIICAKKSSLTLTNCNLSGEKGIYCGIESSLIVSLCRFEGTGIVSDKASSIVLEEVSFKNLKDKRAMSLTNCRKVTIKKSMFLSCGYDVKNTEKEEGGAILMRDGIISIHTCHFENCTASGDGGAISLWKSGYIIKDSKFIKCKSGLNGGAMVIHDTIELASGVKDTQPIFGFIFMGDYGKGVPMCTDVEFLGCAAANYGGAVMSYTRDLCFAKCLFEKCSAPLKGGGVTIMGSDVSKSYTRFFACRFVENNAIDGNGLWMERFRCGDQPSASEDERNDIRESTFHKCTTNHDHNKNSDGRSSCLLNRQNTFTQ